MGAHTHKQRTHTLYRNATTRSPNSSIKYNDCVSFIFLCFPSLSTKPVPFIPTKNPLAYVGTPPPPPRPALPLNQSQTRTPPSFIGASQPLRDLQISPASTDPSIRQLHRSLHGSRHDPHCP